jgi:REP element-mobilizing transposase RayT
MARKLRLQYPGAVYHVMSRGDRREPIFTDDHDRKLFLKTLGEACEKTDWQIHSWCLMSNPFHLVVETPRANLVDGMKWFLGTYTSRFNHRQKELGHLFSGRYKALLVEGSGNGYLKTVCDYVHLNPVRASLLVPEEPIQNYPWSSYRSYLQQPSTRPPWLRVDRLFGEWRIPQDSPAGREHFASCMETGRRAENQSDGNPLGKGWCLGSEEFRKELLAHVKEQAGSKHTGPEVQESALLKAQQILAEELSHVDWTTQHLHARRKGDAQKLRIAARLRRETTMTLQWIAEHLHMGTPSHLSSLLYRQPKNQPDCENKVL